MNNVPDRDRLVESLQAVEAVLSEQGVEHLAIYGSRARGDARADSDLDVLIDVAPDRIFSLIDLIKIEHNLRDRLRIPSASQCVEASTHGFVRPSKATSSRFSSERPNDAPH